MEAGETNILQANFMDWFEKAWNRGSLEVPKGFPADRR
jgi:hypothetical protein